MSLNRDILFIGVDGGDRNFATVTTTGPIFLAPGTATNPTLTFVGDRNTGLYNPAQDALGVTVGGVQNAYFVGTHLLLGGLTTDGTGVLQFPAATTSAGGIWLGTDVNWFRTAAAASTITGSLTTTAGISATSGTFSNQVIVNGLGSATFPAYAAGGGSGNSGLYFSSVAGSAILATNGTAALTLDSSQNASFVGGIISYKGVTTAGWGVAAIQKAGRVTAQSAANASISTYTCGAADGSFEVSANMNVTASTALSTTLTCTYTDESNTARTMIFPVAQLAGSFIAGGLITGTGSWETPVLHIRVKASTAITILTSAGTFNTVTYTAEGIIKQTA